MKQHLTDFSNSFPKNIKWILILFFTFFSSSMYAQKVKEEGEGIIDVVFCLDLSGSTNGLIDNLRESVWSLINQTSKFKPEQQLRIGVVGFSRPSFGKNNAYVKTLCKLTNDFDHMTAELWKLKPEVEKGDQFVSNALIECGNQMNWSKSKNALKIIFLIGNGYVNTGVGDYRTVVNELKEKNIQIVPVYCLRSKKTKETYGWQQIGLISNINYESIWVQKREILVKPIQDDGKLITLIKDLDNQIIPYTKSGLDAFSELKVCDNKAILLPKVSFENRLYYRISDTCLKKLETWDLVSGNLNSPADLLKIDMLFLEDSLKNTTANQLFEKIESKRKERNRLLNEIKKLLPEARQEYLNELVSRSEFKTDFVLEKVLLKTMADLAAGKGISTH
ncbi:MAG TPA: VWA domain-containing protein [Bacteroidia bacterium]|nr:VWA domain-containing protein [Bacteroidia bacterium]